MAQTVRRKKGEPLQVSRYLLQGKEHAITARALARMLGTTPREISRAIEAERRAGVCIIAASDPPHQGYYLAQYRDEVTGWQRTMTSRMKEIQTTRDAVIAHAMEYPERSSV